MKTSLIICAFFTFFLMESCSKNGQETNNVPDEISVNLETGCEGGDDEDPQPMLHGTVTDTTTSDSLQGVCVELRTSADVFVAIIGTNSDGHYYFNEVNNGSYKLVFAKDNYITKVIPVNILGSPQTVNAPLKEIVIIP